MRFLQTILMQGLVVALGAVTGFAATSNEIAVAIRDLGAADYRVREKATEFLTQAGTEAITALTAATYSRDPEVQQRAMEILPSVKFGLTKEISSKVREAVADYETAHRSRKPEIVALVMGLGDKGRPILLRLAAAEPVPELRYEAFQAVADLQQALPCRFKDNDTQLEAVLADFRFCQTILPEDITTALCLIGHFDANGPKKAADTVFDYTYAMLEQCLARQARSDEARNNLAWLCANARRRQVDGLKHVRLALVAQPDSVVYLDTYAELLFQTGKTDEALGIVQQLIKRDPHEPYFREQLARMKKGDPAAPLPPPPLMLKIEIELP